MQDSSASAVLLPFGSLMGNIPVDSIAKGRVLGGFSKVIAGQRPSKVQQQIHSVIQLGCTAWPPSSSPSGGRRISSPEAEGTGG